MGVKFNDLNWKRIEDDFDIDDGFDDGTFYGLEEIDDVDVVKDAGSVKLVPKSERKGPSQEKQKPQANQKPEKKKKKPKQKSASKQEAAEKEEDDNAFAALSKAEQEPVHSLGSWPAGLDWRIYTGLRNKGFSSPTEIQAQSIPLVMKGYDVIGKAATGSGKTLAYSIPLLNRYYARATTEVEQQDGEKQESEKPESDNEDETDREENKDKVSEDAILARPEGLIVSPTRELAHQIRDHLHAIVPPQDKGKIVALTGGLAIQKQLRQLSRGPAIVVATPGRLLEVLEQMSSRQQSEWQRLPSLVLDEADRLVQSGNFAELEATLKIIGVSHKRQVLVYSATFNTDLWSSLNSNRKRKREDIRDIMQQKLGLNKTAHLVDADPEGQVADNVRQAIIECPNMEKDLYAYYFLLLYPGKSILFVNSIDAVKRIGPLFKELGLPAIGVHSEMAQKQRLRAIEKFSSTKNAVLVATDVAARGLDVPLVDHVVHYHLPRTGDMYVHRSGRTARAGNMGVSVVLCSPQEASGPLPNLLKLIGTKPQHIDVDYDILEKLRDRAKLAKKIADTQMLATKKGKTDSWLAGAADELGVDLDEDLKLDGKGDKASLKAAEKNAGALRDMRTELAEMMQHKLGTNRRYLTSGTENLAHQMLKQKEADIFGKPVRSALDELASKKRKQTPAQTKNKKRKGKNVSLSGVTNA